MGMGFLGMGPGCCLMTHEKPAPVEQVCTGFTPKTYLFQTFSVRGLQLINTVQYHASLLNN